MEYIDGQGTYLWKKALLEQRPHGGEASSVGDTLGRIHSASATSTIDHTLFQNQRDFSQLRVDPYFRFTMSRHPDRTRSLQRRIDALSRHELVLLHGDVSPKNILFRNGRPILLDAECATMGDPAFDVAFCANHLILKAIHMPEHAETLLVEVAEFWSAYAQHCSWENVELLESRVCETLPALMLARVDGKSPVEYLAGATRELVREYAREQLVRPATSVSELLGMVRDASRRSTR